jgi:tetratricopeptide (TPR) repeat protein
MVTAEEIRQALERVLTSAEFAGSPRLQSFLRYIVEQELDGHGSSIKGKVIATDVYDKELDENGGALNLVRVEARRLRRGLEDYYSGAGRSDPLRINMQTGGYRPQFERFIATKPSVGQSQSESSHSDGLWRHKLLLPLIGTTLLLIFVLWYFGLRGSQSKTEFATVKSSAELAALRERSITSVQAVNLAEQTRGLFFPLFDLRRQAINLETFRYVIELDPNLAAGYAGSAQVLTLKSLLTSNADASTTLIGEALEMAEHATTLDPLDGWSQAAHGWTLAVTGDIEGALSRARIALDLSPQDGHTLDLIGITALVVDDPVFMAEVSHPQRSRLGVGRFAYNNIYGASQLMLENYDEVIEAFSKAAERGHPVSPPSLFLLATAFHETGNPAGAEKAIVEMLDTWPDFPAHEVIARFFVNDSATRSRVLSVLDLYSPS